MSCCDFICQDGGVGCDGGGGLDAIVFYRWLYYQSTSTTAVFAPFFSDSEGVSAAPNAQRVYYADQDIRVVSLYTANANGVVCDGLELTDIAGTSLYTTGPLAPLGSLDVVGEILATPVDLVLGTPIGIRVVGHALSPSQVFVIMGYEKV